MDSWVGVGVGVLVAVGLGVLVVVGVGAEVVAAVGWVVHAPRASKAAVSRAGPVVLGACIAYSFMSWTG